MGTHLVYTTQSSATHAFILNVLHSWTLPSSVKQSCQTIGETTKLWNPQIIQSQSFGFTTNCLKPFWDQYSITEKHMKIIPKVYPSLFLCYSKDETQILM